MQPPTLGILLTATASFWGAVFLIAFQVAAREAARPTVVLVLVGIAAVLNTAAALVQRRGRLRLDGIALRLSLILAACTVLGNIGMAGALALIDPALVSVVLQLQVIVVALMELLILRSAIPPRLWTGTAIALAGFVCMQWSPDLFSGELATDTATRLLGITWALAAVISFAAMLVATRRVVDRIDNVTVNALRLWMATALLALWPGAVAGALTMSAVTWWACLIAAACGPTLGRVLLMYAVAYLPAAQAKLVTLITPVFALILAWIWAGTVPGPRDLLGGLLILVGVALPLLAMVARQRKQAVAEEE